MKKWNHSMKINTADATTVTVRPACTYKNI